MQHDCVFWQNYLGTNPQTGEEFNKWECCHVMMPLMQLEIAKQQRHTSAALESTRNIFSDALSLQKAKSIGGQS